MTTQELAAKTVIELRKIAKENGVTLGAGISKDGIIQKLTDAFAQKEPAEQPAPPAPAPAEEPAPAEDPKPAADAQPQFRAAWHNPAPRYNNKPAYQAPAYQQRQAGWQGGVRNTADAPRQTPVRPAGYTPRFGPGAADSTPEQPQRHEEEYRTFRTEPVRPAYTAPERRPAYTNEAPRSFDRPAYEAPRQAPYEQRPAYDQRPAYEQQPAYQQRDDQFSRPYQPRPAYGQQQQRPAAPYYAQNDAGVNPGAAELLSAAECLDGSGVLEMHPDGYGFLRSGNFLPSSKDIYVSMAQIRRFSLRTGDYVVGKTRPQREGDKYSAMLYINEINGLPADSMPARPLFEELTPIYPKVRIDLESHDGAPLDDMRLTDLIAPMGFGQRGLILCPPDAGKTAFLQHFANAVTANYPDAEVIVLLLDENPEDVTLFRDDVNCRVLASTFDQPPENHLRLADLVLEYAQRRVEMGKDVVLVVDSLTRLAKIYTTAAAQQGRSMPGMVNPASLMRAKKLFGAARCLKEGGSLTVIAAMNIETGSKVDDTIVEEFKGTANMELVLDAALASAGVNPPINLQLSGTKRVELLLTPAQLEGLNLVRSMLQSTKASAAIPQLISLMDKAESNDALMAKIKDWVALLENAR